MTFYTPIDRSTSREVAQSMIVEGDKEFQIKIGDTVLAVMNPGGVLGENIAQLIRDLRREIIDVVDAIRPAVAHGPVTTDLKERVSELESEVEDLKSEVDELKDEINDFEESCGRHAK